MSRSCLLFLEIATLVLLARNDNELSEQPAQPFSPTLLKHLHHLLRFAVLLDQAVHILHFHTCACRDSSTTRGVQNIRVTAFLASHGIDDRLRLLEVLLDVLWIHLTCS